MELLKSMQMANEKTVEVVYHDRIKIDLDSLKVAYSRLDEFTKMQRLKKLVIVGRNTDITRDARKFGESQSKIREKLIVAEAWVVHTLPQKMIANFYAYHMKGSFPIKYFTEVEKAREWLDGIED